MSGLGVQFCTEFHITKPHQLRRDNGVLKLLNLHTTISFQ